MCTMAKLALSLAVVCALSAALGFAQRWPEGKDSDRFDAVAIAANPEIEVRIGNLQ